MRALVVACLAGCGRVDFDPRADVATPITISIGQNPGDQGSVADSYIPECSPLFEYGGSTHIHVKDGTTCPADGHVVGLVRFDLSTVPVTAHVTNATLRMWTHGTTTLVASHEFHRVLESWIEGASPDVGMAGPPNWTQREPGIAWTGAGCGAGSCDPAVIGSFVTVAAPDTMLETPLATDVVQRWIDRTYENDGLAIKAPGTAGMTASALETREGIAGEAPELVLSYSP